MEDGIGTWRGCLRKSGLQESWSTIYTATDEMLDFGVNERSATRGAKPWDRATSGRKNKLCSARLFRISPSFFPPRIVLTKAKALILSQSGEQR